MTQKRARLNSRIHRGGALFFAVVATVSASWAQDNTEAQPDQQIRTYFEDPGFGVDSCVTGTQMWTYVPAEQVMTSERWHPDRGVAPPLSPAMAARAAHRQILQTGSLADGYEIERISLRIAYMPDAPTQRTPLKKALHLPRRNIEFTGVNVGTWFYHVTYRKRGLPPGVHKDYVTFPVLMSGKVFPLAPPVLDRIQSSDRNAR